MLEEVSPRALSLVKKGRARLFTDEEARRFKESGMECARIDGWKERGISLSSVYQSARRSAAEATGICAIKRDGEVYYVLKGRK